MKNPLVSLRKITLHPPSRVAPILHEISLEIFPNDFIILLGSNGSGKSSLLKIINGLLTPTSGDLLFQGQNIKKMPLSSRSQAIATLTQDPQGTTFSELTVFENCLIAKGRLTKISFSFPKAQEKKEICEMLAKYSPSLSERIDALVSSLSGGERQTLGFAMATFSAPSLLLLDEHTSALDPVMGDKLMQLTHHVANNQPITTVMTTHHLHDALRFGNRLIAMQHGKIILDVAGPEKERLSKEELYQIYTVRR